MLSNLGSLGGRPRRSSTNGILGGFGAVPSQWSPDSRVKLLQAALNAQMSGSGCSTILKTDGLIGPMTCGSLAWSKATGSPPTAYTSYASDMDAGCGKFTPKAPACPTAAVPGPTPAPDAALAPPPPQPSLMPQPIATVTAPRQLSVVPRAPADLPPPPVATPGGSAPWVAGPMAPPAAHRGPSMTTIAIIGGAVVAAGIGFFLLTGKKKSAPAKAA